MTRTAIRIATLVVTAATASHALAQLVEPSLFSPAPLASGDWVMSGTPQPARLAQDVAPAPAPVTTPAPEAPAPVTTPAPEAPAAGPAPAAAPAPTQPQAAAQPKAPVPAPPPAQASAPSSSPAPAPAPLAALPEPAEPTGPTLRREATVVGEIVRVGDLVENAGVVADVPIFRAPDLGQTGSVSTASVIAAVRQHHIIWLDTRGLDEVLVTRAARTVTAKDIEARLLRALGGQIGASDLKDLSVSFDGEVRPFHVEPTTDPSIARLSYDPRSRRFDVTFDVPARAGRRTPLRMTGALVETVEAVVTLRNIPQGEVIKAGDVMIERRPKTEVIAIEEVLGFAAKHALRAGQVMRAIDVTKPELVARNETVTITYEAPGMVLSIRGQAMEGGALGDVISVTNVQSKRTLQATVTAPGRVTVTATPARKVAAADSVTPQR